MLLEEDIQDPVAAVETEILDPKAITAVIVANSGITNTTGVYGDNKSHTLIFTTNPTPEAKPDPIPENKPTKNMSTTMKMMTKIMIMTMTKSRK